MCKTEFTTIVKKDITMKAQEIEVMPKKHDFEQENLEELQRMIENGEITTRELNCQVCEGARNQEELRNGFIMCHSCE